MLSQRLAVQVALDERWGWTASKRAGVASALRLCTADHAPHLSGALVARPGRLCRGRGGPRLTHLPTQQQHAVLNMRSGRLLHSTCSVRSESGAGRQDGGHSWSPGPSVTGAVRSARTADPQKRLCDCRLACQPDSRHSKKVNLSVPDVPPRGPPGGVKPQPPPPPSADPRFPRSPRPRVEACRSEIASRRRPPKVPRNAQMLTRPMFCAVSDEPAQRIRWVAVVRCSRRPLENTSEMLAPCSRGPPRGSAGQTRAYLSVSVKAT